MRNRKQSDIDQVTNEVVTSDLQPNTGAAVIVPGRDNLIPVSPDNSDLNIDNDPQSLQQEVAASPIYSLNTGLLDFIANYDDHCRREYGDDTYDQMEADDTEVSKCFNLLTSSVVSDSYTLTSATTLLDDPTYDDAKNIRDFINRCLDNAAANGTPFRKFAEQMLAAIKYGHKIGEQTLEWGKDEDKDRLVLKSLKVKPQKSINIMVDQFMNIQGYQPVFKKDSKDTGGETAGVNTSPDKSNLGSIDGVANTDDKIYSKEKFIHFALRQADEDPRGHSSFRAAVMPYKSKKRMAPEYIRYLLQCAIPGLVFIAPEQDDGVKQYQYGTDGKPKRDAGGKLIPVSRVQKLVTEGQKFRNSSVMAMEHGGQVEQIEVKGEGGAFKGAREIWNEDIEQSILFNILATSQGKYQARSASQTHQDVLDLVIAYLREALVESITIQCFRILILKNFGKKFLPLMPKLSFGDTERRNFAVDGKTVASLAISKFLHTSQYPGLDAMLGIEQRDPKMWAEFVKEQQQMEKDALQMKKNSNNNQKNGQSRSSKKRKGTALPAPNTDPKRT